MKAIKITEYGACLDVELDPEAPMLKQLQAHVKGDIEAVRMASNTIGEVVMWINAEGKYSYLSNPIATAAAYLYLLPGDWIAGPVIITGEDSRGDVEGLPATFVSQFIKMHTPPIEETE